MPSRFSTPTPSLPSINSPNWPPTLRKLPMPPLASPARMSNGARRNTAGRSGPSRAINRLAPSAWNEAHRSLSRTHRNTKTSATWHRSPKMVFGFTPAFPFPQTTKLLAHCVSPARNRNRWMIHKLTYSKAWLHRRVSIWKTATRSIN